MQPSSSSPSQPASIGGVLRGHNAALLQDLLPAYLVRQRWFGGKSRTLASAAISSTLLLNDGVFALTTVEVAYTDGSTDTYQLPLAVASGEAAVTIRTTAPKAVLASLGEGASDSIVYDASASEDFRKHLLTLMHPASAPTELGASVSPSADLSAIGEEISRVGSAEQSNTSILFGQSAILKLFRRLEPGQNPDVEICRFLTGVAHFPNIPAYLGEFHRTSNGSTLAFLQEFAPNEGDGWAWFQQELLRFYSAAASLPAPRSVSPSTGSPATFGSRPHPPQEGLEHAATSIEAAALLGRRTAEMHLALDTPTDDPAFAAVDTTAADLAADTERLRNQTQTALAALERSLATLPPAVQRDARTLLDRAGDLGQLSAAPRADVRYGRRTRIHGDYHLGQTLRSRSDFVLVDFEGEPARSLEERRTKQSPLRDVAGMLRSFSYAARSALALYAEEHTAPSMDILPWAALWENAISARFLQEYADVIRRDPALLPDDTQAQLLLSRYLLEKALYELLYELNNRPGWVAIPLSGLLALLGPVSAEVL